MRTRAFALVLLALALLHGELALVRGAAIIEDHSTSWASAGLTDSLAEAVDMALPDELFEKVLQECIVFEAHERAERDLFRQPAACDVRGERGCCHHRHRLPPLFG